MRNFALTLLLALSSTTAFSQIVGLNNVEIKQLKVNLTKNENLRKEYDTFEQSTANFLSDQPNAIDTIRTEGLLKGNPKKIKTAAALADIYKMYATALLYRLNSDKKYLNKSIEFLNAWAKINQPNGDPIDDTNLERAVEAYDLIKQEIPNQGKRLIIDWLRNTANAEINSKRMKPGRTTAINNWNAHRLKIVGLIGYAINDRELISWTIDHLKKHIEINLYPDGTSFDFKERDAMHYHIYDLEPMLKLAIAIDRAKGEDFYHYQSTTGSSIQKSVEWMIPYVKGEKQHEEYVNTKVKFDRDRAKNGEAGFAAGSFFKPSMALPVFKYSSYFDPAQQNLLTLMEYKPNWQNTVDRMKGLK